jgi:hypothetical protein
LHDLPKVSALPVVVFLGQHDKSRHVDDLPKVLGLQG